MQMTYNHVLVSLKDAEPLELIISHVRTMVQSGLVGKVTFLRIAGVEYPQTVMISPTCNNIIMNPKAREEAIARDTFEARTYLSQLVSTLRPYSSNIYWEVLPPDIVVYAIANYVIRNGVDLIIMASHARAGISRWFFGNKAEQVLKLVNIPVMMIRIPKSGASV
jgi:nucleotide-binding universal stress UspA family protein